MNQDLLATVSFMKEGAEIAIQADVLIPDDGELCVTEGRMRRLSPEGDEDQGIPAAEGAIPNEPELTPSATVPVQKTSGIRRLLGLGKKKNKAANNPGTSALSSPDVL